MDTAPAAPGENVNPQIVENYNGEDLTLLNGTVLSVEKFPHLKNLKGRTLITTDGTTLLGADDKAGIAEIMTACERIINENIPHGKICNRIYTRMRKLVEVLVSLMLKILVQNLHIQWMVE